MGAFIIEKFYLFFQGIIMFQVAFFAMIYLLTKRREILFYTVLNFVTSIYFMLNAPFTFFNIAEEVIFNSTWYLYINFALILLMVYWYLRFLKEMFKEDFEDQTIRKIYFYSKAVLPLLYLLFLFFSLMVWPTNLIFYLGHMTNGPLITMLIMRNYRKSGYISYIIKGLMAVFLAFVVTMLMTLRYNTIHHHYFFDNYPLLYIRIGMLIDIIFFQLAIFSRWRDQELELATKDIEAKLSMERMKNKINRELHDEIGTTMSKINLQSYMAIHKLEDKNFDIAQALNSIKIATEQSLQKIRNLIDYGSVDPLGTVIFGQTKKDYLLPLCQSHNIQLISNIECMDSISLPAHVKNHFNLIIKEAANNAVKYSQCTTLEITAHHEDAIITLMIIDNGNGYEQSKVKMGNGIKNMHFRAEELNAIITIESIVGKGTSIALRCSIFQ
jgi:signal transduction histidine kinase